MASKKSAKKITYKVREGYTHIAHGKDVYKVSAKGTVSLPAGADWVIAMVNSGILIKA